MRRECNGSLTSNRDSYAAGFALKRRIALIETTIPRGMVKIKIRPEMVKRATEATVIIFDWF